MGFNLELDGLEELQKALLNIGDKNKISRIENKVLKKGAEPILQEMIKNAPVSKASKKHAREYLKIGSIKTEDGVKKVGIGITRADNSEAFYLKFAEFGWSIPFKRTVKGKVYTLKAGGTKVPARPFMQPAMNAKQGDALEIIKKTLKDELGL